MLKPNTTYYVKARSISDLGESPDSNVIQVKTANTLENLNITTAPPQPIINLEIKKNTLNIKILNTNDITNLYNLKISTFSDYSSFRYDLNF